jgi:hypothetical protein
MNDDEFQQCQNSETITLKQFKEMYNVMIGDLSHAVRHQDIQTLEHIVKVMDDGWFKTMLEKVSLNVKEETEVKQ